MTCILARTDSRLIEKYGIFASLQAICHPFAYEAVKIQQNAYKCIGKTRMVKRVVSIDNIKKGLSVHPLREEVREIKMSVAESSCPDCGAANPAVRSFCVACGGPLWVPENQSTAEVPANALETWKKATDEWKNALKGDEPDVLFWGHIASLLTLAVTYAGSTHFPRAHAHLAIALLSLGRDVDAEREANIALQQNPAEFRAQQVRVVLALNRELLREERASSLFPFPNHSNGHSRDPVLSKRNGRAKKNSPKPTVEAGSTRSASLASKSSLVAELEQMVTIFRNLCHAQTDVDEYLNIADFLVMVGDGMANMPLADWRARLYSMVANTPTDRLDCRGREAEVEDVRQRARMGSLLFELKPEQRVARRRSSSKFAFLQ